MGLGANGGEGARRAAACHFCEIAAGLAGLEMSAACRSTQNSMARSSSAVKSEAPVVPPTRQRRTAWPFRSINCFICAPGSGDVSSGTLIDLN